MINAPNDSILTLNILQSLIVERKTNKNIYIEEELANELEQQWEKLC